MARTRPRGSTWLPCAVSPRLTAKEPPRNWHLPNGIRRATSRSSTSGSPCVRGVGVDGAPTSGVEVVDAARSLTAFPSQPPRSPRSRCNGGFPAWFSSSESVASAQPPHCRDEPLAAISSCGRLADSIRGDVQPGRRVVGKDRDSRGTGPLRVDTELLRRQIRLAAAVEVARASV